MRFSTLVFLYRKRLQLHGAQELLAGAGVAVAVALVFAVTVTASSLTSSATELVHTVAGPADLQIQARGPEGFSEHVLGEVEHLPGVMQAASLLEETATITAGDGHRVIVTLAGARGGLAFMDGLSRTLPGGVLSADGISLSTTTARRLGISEHASPHVRVVVRGRAYTLAVSAVLGREAAGALSVADVAVMPLEHLQSLASLPHRVTRILIRSAPGRHALVKRELEQRVGGTLTVAGAKQEVELLAQALKPSNQASALFAGLAALLGFLLAFNAILLTTPERRAAIADLRLDGTRRAAIIEMVFFQALCLGVTASAIGLLGGYVLAREAFQASPGYLAQAFTLGGNTVIGVLPVVFALAGGIAATCLASLVPLQDLRRGRPLDAVYQQTGESEGIQGESSGRWLTAAALLVLVLAAALFAFVPSAAIFTCVLLALATILLVPVLLALLLAASRALSMRSDRFRTLPLVTESLRARTIGSLALAATGAVALFGCVALGGSQNDLLRGLHNFAHAYASDGEIWVLNPGYTPETTSFPPAGYRSQIERVPGVARVKVFESEFMNLPSRRIVIVSRPPGTGRELLRTQMLTGNPSTAYRRLGEGGWVAVSKAIAEEQHAKVGQTIELPTPTGVKSFKLAGLTTNFGWPGGAVLMDTVDYSKLWASDSPSALVVTLKPGVGLSQERRTIAQSLGGGTGLETITASIWRERFDGLAGEGLSQLGAISTLLVIAAILAMAGALGSSVWERRVALAELRLEGTRRRRLRWMLLLESMLMLGTGCIAGAGVGVAGQFVIDQYLQLVTGFPVARIASAARPLETLVLVVGLVLLLIAVPAWAAAGVAPAEALAE